jgi:CDP-glucose 4,6-dehydratase
MGTANLLDACRGQSSVKVVVVITTDKVYENKHWAWGYRETDRLGGGDPYSASKAAAEIVVESWRTSFLEAEGIAVATARAGNVIGGGDWSEDRIVPDAVRAFAAGRALGVRNPDSIRPWQHVTDSLTGYLLLAEACWRDTSFATAWNFGPDPGQVAPVSRVADLMVAAWEQGSRWENQAVPGAPKEAAILLLDSAQARSRLNWQPCMDLETVIATTMAWYRCFLTHGPGQKLGALTAATIADALGTTHR